LSETTYTVLTWTAGDYITEAKMNLMLANGRAVDAMYKGVELTERAAPDTPGANKIHLYAKDKAGLPVMYVIDDAGGDYEVLTTDSIAVVHSHISAVTGGALYSYRAFAWGIKGNIVTGDEQGMKYICPQNMTVKKIWYKIGSGTNCGVRIQKDTTTVDTFTAEPTVGSTTVISSAALTAGEVITLDVYSISGTPIDLFVTMECNYLVKNS